jgi:hypothetical protein
VLVVVVEIPGAVLAWELEHPAAAALLVPAVAEDRGFDAQFDFTDHAGELAAEGSGLASRDFVFSRASPG